MRTCLLLAALMTVFLAANGNVAAAPAPKRVPPKGITLPSATRTMLLTNLNALGKEILSLQTDLQEKPELLALLPDVQIYFNAVQYAIAQETFYNNREFPTAEALLQHGLSRARLLRAGNPSWTTSTGLVVRGYVSRIDGSVQPYGLVIPSSWQPGATNKLRLDFWFHGRDDRLTEIKFINEHQTRAGQLTPPDTFVLHPYGRYCNASKFAGEIDAFEALAHVSKSYSIDERRLAVRGFSMGGGTAWHLATHYAGLWRAAQPGAGFAETPLFANVFARDPKPTWYEEKLFRLYDATEYAGNLYHCKTLAYYGDQDPQKQAAEVMAKAMAAEGLELETIVGVKTRHAIERNARGQIDARMDAIMTTPRNPVPKKIHFTTFTLRYPTMLWVTVDELEQHWERARVEANIIAKKSITATTENVAALTFSMPAGQAPFPAGHAPKISINGTTMTAPAVAADRSWSVHLRKTGERWDVVPYVDSIDLRKRPGLQGPIDDAFMDSFLMVKPTGRALNAGVATWIASEFNDAVTDWLLQFRGQPRMKDDSAVTDEDIAAHNLILWGDPSSNKLLAKIADRLPIRWDAKGVVVGAETFALDKHVPALIHPNPLNPKRYVVLNTGFTFSESGTGNNALQIPRLPDYAVIDITVPRARRMPLGVVNAGFFDERWQLKAQ
ncbi:MAG: prolyl oligopeptidase family serine peptidase [Verrucomicrobiota bacterium]